MRLWPRWRDVRTLLREDLDLFITSMVMSVVASFLLGYALHTAGFSSRATSRLNWALNFLLVSVIFLVPMMFLRGNDERTVRRRVAFALVVPYVAFALVWGMFTWASPAQPRTEFFTTVAEVIPILALAWLLPFSPNVLLSTSKRRPFWILLVMTNLVFLATGEIVALGGAAGHASSGAAALCSAGLAAAAAGLVMRLLVLDDRAVRNLPPQRRKTD